MLHTPAVGGLAITTTLTTLTATTITATNNVNAVICAVHGPPLVSLARSQVLKIMMLGYTRSVIAGGGPPGASPGRERLALAGVGAAGMAGLVHGLLKRRIEEAGE